jgi:uncharacterized protein YjbI with pentapeptide repeats
MEELWDVLTALSQPWATLFGSVIGGSIVGAGALLGFRASMKTRETLESVADKTHEREVMAARQERYTTIAEQLSSEHETVRLAGVYALAALADEWQRAGELGQRDVAIKLLCAYLRAKPRKNGGDKSTPLSDSEVRKAIVLMIQTHTDKTVEPRWEGSLIDLSGADLSGANFSGTDLTAANFSRANLSGANLLEANLSSAQFPEAQLSKATLTYADLSHASLWRSDLSGAYLTESTMSWADMSGADLSGATLTQANLWKVNIWEADLSGAFMWDADLTEADLSGSNLSEAKMMGVKLQKANLSDVKLIGAELSMAELISANLSRANLSGTNLEGADLYKADMTGVDRTMVDLTRTLRVPEDGESNQLIEPESSE